MKKILTTICVFMPLILFSQEEHEIDILMQHIQQMAESTDSDNEDYSEIMEIYQSLFDNPININSEDMEQLVNYNIINVFQLHKIKEYRKNYGDIMFYEELLAIDSIDDNTKRLLKPIITFQKETENKTRFKDIFIRGSHRLVLQADRCFNKKEGYKNVSDSVLCDKPNSVYLGSPERLFLRYNFNFVNRLEFGFVLEKDAGEYFFLNKINDSIRKTIGDKAYKGFDFFSFHIYLHETKWIKDFAVGDYQLSFGQGLTLGSGMSFFGSDSNIMRKGKKIRASKSANEGRYFRGVATTVSYKNMDLSIFYSFKRADGNISITDDKGDAEEITSIQQSGLHRTAGDILDRKAFKQQFYGFNLSYKNEDTQIGYTVHKTDMSASLYPDERIYNIFYFRGKTIVNQGIDFYHIMNKIALFGEVSLYCKYFALLSGVTVQPRSYITLTLLYRNYDKRYNNLYNNAFSSSSNTRNEKGFYLGGSVSLTPKWKLCFSADMFNSDWLKNTAYSPTYGNTLNIKIENSINEKSSFFIQYRYKKRIKNTADTDVYQRYTDEEHGNMLRFDISYSIKRFTFKNLIEYHFKNFDGERNMSYLIYQDIVFRPYNEIMKLYFRYAVFNSSKGGLYIYENDVLYSFSVSSLYNKGIRIYLCYNIRPFKRLQVLAKLGMTIYDNVDIIGSGLESIEGNKKIDGKLQMIYKI